MTQIQQTGQQGLQKKEEGLKALTNRPEIQAKFREMLGQKTTGFLVSLLSIVQTNNKLQQADPNSILFAAGIAASLDLPINQNLGFAYIVPYKQKLPNGQYADVAQFQLGWKGLVQLAQRSGQFETISTAIVYEGQIKSDDPLEGYVFDWKAKTSDKVIGYCAHFKLLNGFRKTLFMSIDQVKKHGGKYSKTFSQRGGVWESEFDAMAQKTVLKQLLGKYAPLSIEMQKAIITDQAKVNDWDGQNLEYVDNQDVTLDPEQVSQAKEYQRIIDHINDSTSPEQLGQVEEYLMDDLHKAVYGEKKIALSKK
jgi:recombination protein RecT